MEITGRLVTDAKATALKDGRSVVNFSIAINDRFKSKGSDTVTKLVTYVNCSYWLHPGIAPYLTKGSIVELYGRIGTSVWVNKEGEAKANLTMHVQNIKNFGSRTNGSETNEQHEGNAMNTPAGNADGNDGDLPF